MENATGVLVVDDEKSLRFTLCEALKDEGYEAFEAADGSEAFARLREHDIDLVLLDLRLQASGEDGITLLKAIKHDYPGVEVIMMTAYGKFENAVEATKAGCYQFLAKPFQLEQLKVVMAGAFESAALKNEVEVLRRNTKARFPTDQIVGESEAFAEVLQLVQKVAGSAAPILLLGETGAGKEVLARAVHRASGVASGPMVEVNCSAVPENLLESELFGHEKGAFTDAKDRKKGVFELADGGTLFLDEIGDMDFNLQAKLLRVLETGAFKRVGGTANIQVSVRVVAATHRDLKKAVAGGKFREDLYYRLAVVPVFIPPLRERREDIPALAEFFLSHLKTEMGLDVQGFTESALEAMVHYAWPGNVRELRNVVERAALLVSGPDIDVDQLPAEVLSGGAPLQMAAAHDHAEAGHETLAHAERGAILRAMERFEGNKTKAASALGISRGTLRAKLKQYDLAGSEDEAPVES